MEEKNAVIKSASIEIEDHGILSGWLYLDYGDSGQGFGGYALYLPKSYNHHILNVGYAGHWIYRVLEIAGVNKWSDLPGKTIRVKCDWNKIRSIGHIIKDDWFTPDEEFHPQKTLADITPEMVETLAKSYPGISQLYMKIPRIKAVRELVPGTGLKEAKDWVENHFAR